MDVLQELGSRATLLHDQHNGLEIDTSDPDMGASWQQTLAHLQARLDALERDFPAQQRAQGHNRDEGIGY
jgi:hypothetical protein